MKAWMVFVLSMFLTGCVLTMQGPSFSIGYGSIEVNKNIDIHWYVKGFF